MSRVAVRLEDKHAQRRVLRVEIPGSIQRGDRVDEILCVNGHAAAREWKHTSRGAVAQRELQVSIGVRQVREGAGSGTEDLLNPGRVLHFHGQGRAPRSGQRHPGGKRC